MMGIRLNETKTALVDDNMFETLNKYKWTAHRCGQTFYADRKERLPSGKRKVIQMHHLVVGFPPGKLVVDHIDGNGLNNCLKNLRIVTQRQNTQNRKNEITVSKYPGVGLFKKGPKWRAYITIKGKFKHLGLFNTEIAAYRRYCDAVKEIGQTMLEN